MPSLVTRFHLLILAVTLSITAVAVLRTPPGFAFPAHWHGSGADWLWPRDTALAIAPLVQAALLVAFHGLGRMLAPSHLGKVRHILDPALSLLLSVTTACQLALLFVGIGSDLDLFRGLGFGLGATLMVLGLVFIHAERHSYGGLRLPWPIQSDRAWTLVHRLSGLVAAITGASLMLLAWLDPGAGILVLAFAASLLALPLLAALLTLLFHRA